MKVVRRNPDGTTTYSVSARFHDITMTPEERAASKKRVDEMMRSVLTEEDEKVLTELLEKYEPSRLDLALGWLTQLLITFTENITRWRESRRKDTR